LKVEREKIFRIFLRLLNRLKIAVEHEVGGVENELVYRKAVLEVFRNVEIRNSFVEKHMREALGEAGKV
jgi:hypothetical protein